MRLVSRLSLSQAAPISLLLAALVVVLAAQVRMTSLIGEVRDDELGTIALEEALHDAAWTIEVAARHAAQDCDDTSVEPRVEAELRARGESLSVALSRTPRQREALVKAAENYRSLADRLSAGGACAQLLAPETRREMLRYDEELTDAWVSRLRELHSSMTLKEDEARRLGARATVGGLTTALLACLFAALLARQMARAVTDPVARLSAAARRMGEGDFAAPVPAEGPAELVELGGELDGMRRRLAELDSLKQSFVAHVSHELRTPLTKLREALSLLGDGAAGPLNDRQARVVKIGRDACEREIRMVSTMLDLSRLQAGSPLRPQEGASIDAAVRAAARYESEDAAAKGVAIELDLEGEAPSLSLDAPLVERAIANLVRNAVTASPRGQAVWVEREVLDRGPLAGRGPWVRVVVRDRGPGVAPEVRGALFRPFVTHPVSGRVGVGLGLALVREVARAHGGEVELLDEGPGAAFALWLPAGPAAEAREARRDEA